MTPAEELRTAAQLMRKRARVATGSPWRYDPEKHFRAPGTSEFEESVFVGPVGKDALSVARTGPTDDPASMADAAYIASMHPGVALAVAALLEREAALIEAQVFPQSDPVMEKYPLAVARVYLGSDPQ